MTTPPTLTEAGQKLADALPPESEFADIIREAVSNHNDVDGVFWARVAREVAQAVGDAALLLTAPEGEGAGLREALFGKIAEARRYADREGFGHATLCLPREDTDVLLSALTKQPAAQEPAAAGVGDKNGLKLRERPDGTWGWGLGAAPKTPDAATGGSVGDGGLREEAQAVSGLFDANGSLFCSGEHQLEVVQRLRTALAQPAPVGEDETGVRAEDETCRANYAEGRRQHWQHEAERLAWMVRNLGGDPEAATQPPKAETPAGNASPERIAQALVAADWSGVSIGNKLLISSAALALCTLSKAETPAGAGETEIWHRQGATIYTLKEHEGPCRRSGPTMVNDHSFLVQGPDAEAVAARIHAALSAAPAARPGDGFVLVPREPTEEMQAAGWIDKEDVSPKEIYWAMLAAAPAADGGRA